MEELIFSTNDYVEILTGDALYINKRGLIKNIQNETIEIEFVGVDDKLYMNYDYAIKEGLYKIF